MGDGTGGNIDVLPVNGDTWVTSKIYFGTGGLTSGPAVIPGATDSGAAGVVIHNDAEQTNVIAHASSIGVEAATKNNFAYLKESAISVETSDYFAVGSTVEVLGTTWSSKFDCAADAAGAGSDAASTRAACIAKNTGCSGGQCLWAQRAIDTDVTITGNNKYRKFKVTGHVTNPFNREFAKLDSFPADDGTTPTTTNANKPKYNLKITSNNATVHTYPDLAAQITLNEVQVIVFGTGASTQTGTFKLYYETEETADMDESSSQTQIAEEINSFSHLSGPVNVVAEGNNWVVTFDAKDGDVAEMTAQATSGGVSIATRANGWSIEGPVGLGLDTMQAGGIINITAQEVCTFDEGGAASVGYYCYDGNCGTVSAAPATDIQVVTMPMGKSCDGLEFRGATAEIVKTVNK